jgi:hypothetical protein
MGPAIEDLGAGKDAGVDELVDSTEGAELSESAAPVS